MFKTVKMSTTFVKVEQDGSSNDQKRVSDDDTNGKEQEEEDENMMIKLRFLYVRHARTREKMSRLMQAQYLNQSQISRLEYR